MIQIQSLSKSFAGKTVLKTIDLVLGDGKTHVLLGASGSGKSTLLRMIMGLLYPDHGSVSIDDRKMTSETQRELARKIGFVLQDGGLFPHLSAYDNVCLVAKTLGWSKARIASRVSELLEVVGLERDVLSRPPRQLSGGQKQRVAVMRAAFLNPEVMLLDEPLGALDPMARSHLQSELREIFLKLKKLVVLVTHDIAEAAFFGNTVTLLYEGKVLQHGPFRELLQSPSHPYVTEFIQAQRTLVSLENAL